VLPPEDSMSEVAMEIKKCVEINTTAKDGKHMGRMFVLCKR